MNTALRQDADTIIASSLKAVLPDAAVRRALESEAFCPQGGRILLVAVGKAAWQMAHTAVAALGRVDEGIVITKYGHVRGTIPGVTCYEAGHPVPDENSFAATEKVLTMVQNLTDQDTVLFLLSGGGSALFEKPLIPGAELQEITNSLLAGGADIVEMNTIRKRLSAVKGGRFALACAPAKIFSIVLSDILGDPLDMIASGPAVPDSSTGEQAIAIARKYRLSLSKEANACLTQETPKILNNVTTQITGSDGTDGPTDAAGGYTDGDTCASLAAHGLDVFTVLQNNNAYPALKAVDGLIITGATGTNVNDVSVALIQA